MVVVRSINFYAAPLGTNVEKYSRDLTCTQDSNANRIDGTLYAVRRTERYVEDDLPEIGESTSRTLELHTRRLPMQKHRKRRDGAPRSLDGRSDTWHLKCKGPRDK